jgi:hypothetical protein
MTRNDLVDIEILLPKEYDHCVIGSTYADGAYVAVYDREKVIEQLMAGGIPSY